MGKLITPWTKEFEAPFNIELKEVGVWDTIDFTFSFHDALYKASKMCEFYQEKNIRIMDNTGKII